MTSGRNIMVNFKVSSEELDMIKRGADEEKMTQSDYIRACIVRDRLLAGDRYARTKFAENVSTYVRDTKEAIQAAVSQLVEPLRKGRKPALKAAERPKGGKERP